MEKKYIGSVDVDAGLIWIGDPCYILQKSNQEPTTFQEKTGITTWGDFVKTLYTQGFMQGYARFDTLGVAIRSGLGDGCYPVYATFDQSGIVTQVTIDFADEDNAQEEEERR